MGKHLSIVHFVALIRGGVTLWIPWDSCVNQSSELRRHQHLKISEGFTVKFCCVPEAETAMWCLGGQGAEAKSCDFKKVLHLISCITSFARTFEGKEFLFHVLVGNGRFLPFVADHKQITNMGRKNMACIHSLLSTYFCSVFRGSGLCRNLGQNKHVWRDSRLCVERVSFRTPEAHVFFKVCLHLRHDWHLGGAVQKLRRESYEGEVPYGSLQYWTAKQFCVQKHCVRHVSSHFCGSEFQRSSPNMFAHQTPRKAVWFCHQILKQTVLAKVIDPQSKTNNGSPSWKCQVLSPVFWQQR